MKKSFLKAAEEISKEFGKDAKKIIPLPEKPPVPAYRVGIDPYQKEPTKARATVSKRVATYEYRPEDTTHRLISYLQDKGYEFVLEKFRYQGDTMDLFGILKGKAVEFAILSRMADLEAHLRRIYHMGKVKAKKHVLLKQGKALPAFFWMIVPPGFDTGAIPEPYGIMEVAKSHVGIIREATALHESFIPPGTYKSVAEHLQRLKSP